MSLLSSLIPTYSTKSLLRPCCLKEFALLAHESETSWFPYLFLSKSWRKTNCWNVYTARIRPCCVLEASLPRLRDKRFCVFCGACDNYEPNRYVIWSALKCQSTLDFFSSEPSCQFLKSGPKFYCSLEVDSVLHSSLL